MTTAAGILSSVASPSRARLLWLDEWRGLAVVLMIVDHVLMAMPTAGGDVVRWSLTRFALPIFLVCSGWLWGQYGPSVANRRALHVLLAMALTLPLWVVADFPLPDPLGNWVFAWLMASFLCARPLFWLVVGVLQVTCWPIGLTGYEPGLAIVYASAGILAARSAGSGEILTVGIPQLGWLGRHALLVYASHVPIVVAVATLR